MIISPTCRSEFEDVKGLGQHRHGLVEMPGAHSRVRGIAAVIAETLSQRTLIARNYLTKNGVLGHLRRSGHLSRFLCMQILLRACGKRSFKRRL